VSSKKKQDLNRRKQRERRKPKPEKQG